MSIVIPSNTSIPNTKKGHYMTNYDNQTTILYSGYKGERTRTQDNKLLWEFELFGIPKTPRGVAQIDVCFDTESNGILNVSVEEMTPGLIEEQDHYHLWQGEAIQWGN